MVARARRPTRPLANEPLHPVRRGTGRGGGEGVGAGRARRVAVRACVRARAGLGAVAAPGGPSGRCSSAVGRRARSRGGGGGPRGVGLAGRLLTSPRHARPSAPPLAAPSPHRGATPAWPPDARPPPATTPPPPAYPRPSWCSPGASLSRPTSPATSSLEVWARGSRVWGGAPSLPHRAASVSGAGRAPLSATAPARAGPPVRLGMGGVAVARRGAAVAAPRGGPPARAPARPPAAFPPPALDRLFPRAGRPSSAPGPPPPRRAPLPVLRARGLSSVVRPSVRPSGSCLSLSPFPALPPRVPALPARPPPAPPVEASLNARGGEQGAREAGAGVRGPRGRGGSGFGRGAERRGPRPGASERASGEVSEARFRGHGGDVVGRWAWWCPVWRLGPSPGRGAPESRAGSAGARVLRAAAGGERVGRRRGWRRAWGAPPAPPRPRPPPPSPGT